MRKIALGVRRTRRERQPAKTRIAPTAAARGTRKPVKLKERIPSLQRQGETVALDPASLNAALGRSG